MRIELAYGKAYQSLDIADENLMTVLHPKQVNVDTDDVLEVIRSLDNPIDSQKLSEVVEPGDKVVVLTSDITRPMPSSIVLPPVLEEIISGGVKPEDITIMLAVGSHRGHTEEEKRGIVGEEVYSSIRVIDSSEDTFVNLGATSNGTPIDIAKTVVDSDKVVCLGNVEFHYFAGYSGGYKPVMPGASTMAAIERNHSLMTSPKSKTGILDGNPLREDIDEAGRVVGVDFIVNVVLDEKRRIAKSFAGNIDTAHRAACKFLEELNRAKIPGLADIVVVSPGGHPKDLNLYQSQKALDNAMHAVKRDGVIILVAACSEGLGQRTFAEWMNKANRPSDLITFLAEGFKLGGHKAAAIAKVMMHCDVYLVSELDEQEARNCFFEPFSSLDDAYSHAMETLGSDANVIVMPHGSSTVPSLRDTV